MTFPTTRSRGLKQQRLGDFAGHCFLFLVAATAAQLLPCGSWLSGSALAPCAALAATSDDAPDSPSIPPKPRQKVILLTSVNPNQTMAWCRMTSNRYMARLNATFRALFAQRTLDRYDLQLVSSADQGDLSQALLDPHTVALFWISHAGRSEEALEKSPMTHPTNTLTSTLTLSRPLASGVQPADGFAILDIRGYDVTPIFSKIHPNMRFLAIISCFSDEIKTLEANLSSPSALPQLTLYTFSHEEDALMGLRAAAKIAKSILTLPQVRSGYFPSPMPQEEGLAVVIQRDSGDKTLPAVRIMCQNHLLAVLPKSASSQAQVGGQQRLTFLLPSSAVKPLWEALQVTLGKNCFLTSPPWMGEVTFQLGELAATDAPPASPLMTLHPSSSPEVSTPWKKLAGLGEETHIYEPQSDQLPSEDQRVKCWSRRDAFSSEAMPAYE